MRSSVQARVSNERKKVLVVGQPAQLYLATGLRARSAMECAEAGPGEPLRALYEEQPDLVLIDCGDLEDGCLSAIRKIRLVSGVPIMALVPEGKSGGEALRCGADAIGYTPIRWDEFEARVDRLFDRAESGHEAAVLADEFVEIDKREHAVRCDGVELVLTPTEFRMLVAFAERPDVAIEHGDLVELVWRDGYRGAEEVKLYVSYLRRKFRAAGINPIETLRGFGYRYRPQPLAETETSVAG
jgi:DNA-binding response OmpR family regulator